jgi:hypothetical protein
MSELTFFHVLRFQYQQTCADKKPIGYRSYSSATILGQVFRWGGNCSQGERGVGLVEVNGFRALYIEIVFFVLDCISYIVHRTPYSYQISLGELLSIVSAKAELLFNGESGAPIESGTKTRTLYMFVPRIPKNLSVNLDLFHNLLIWSFFPRYYPLQRYTPALDRP